MLDLGVGVLDRFEPRCVDVVNIVLRIAGQVKPCFGVLVEVGPSIHRVGHQVKELKGLDVPLDLHKVCATLDPLVKYSCADSFVDSLVRCSNTQSMLLI